MKNEAVFWLLFSLSLYPLLFGGYTCFSCYITVWQQTNKAAAKSNNERKKCYTPAGQFIKCSVFAGL